MNTIKQYTLFIRDNQVFTTYEDKEYVFNRDYFQSIERPSTSVKLMPTAQAEGILYPIVDVKDGDIVELLEFNSSVRLPDVVYDYDENEPIPVDWGVMSNILARSGYAVHPFYKLSLNTGSGMFLVGEYVAVFQYKQHTTMPHVNFYRQIKKRFKRSPPVNYGVTVPYKLQNVLDKCWYSEERIRIYYCDANGIMTQTGIMRTINDIHSSPFLQYRHDSKNCNVRWNRITKVETVKSKETLWTNLEYIKFCKENGINSQNCHHPCFYCK